MTGVNANAGAGGYQLKSQLARVCLPAPHANDQRNLAWTNSICILFLIIGVVGFRTSLPPHIPVKPLEEPAPVILEAPPPQAAATERTENEKLEKPNSAPARVVVVTRESPAIKFSVPTIGNLIVPNAMAVAPPGPLDQAAPSPNEPEQPSLLNNTGKSGDRPQPDYPQMAQDLGQQGSVVLLLTADEAGVIVSVEIKQSSGSSILDRAAADFVKRHWTVPPGTPGRRFQARINYIL